MLILILCYLATADDCTARTPQYLEHGGVNTNYLYFDDRTYNAGGVRCRGFSDANNDQVREVVSNMFTCTGTWCQDAKRWPNGWNCPDHTVDCYQVEHIIPKAHSIPELAGCTTNIFGNTIMSHGRWNSELGKSHLNEKKIVYGDAIFNAAYMAVYKCCKGVDPVSIPVPDCGVTPITIAPSPPQVNIGATLAIVLASVVLLISAIASICCVIKGRASADTLSSDAEQKVWLGEEVDVV